MHQIGNLFNAIHSLDNAYVNMSCILLLRSYRCIMLGGDYFISNFIYSEFSIFVCRDISFKSIVAKHIPFSASEIVLLSNNFISVRSVLGDLEPSL